MRTLTEKQAYDVAMRWLWIHYRSMTNPRIGDVIDEMTYFQLDENGYPLGTHGEWDEWTDCVTHVLEGKPVDE